MGSGSGSVSAGSVRRVVAEALAAGERLLADVVAVPGERCFADTLAPLDAVATLAHQAYADGPFYAHVHPEVDVRDAAAAAEAELETWQSSISFRRELYDAVEAYATTAEAAGLIGEDARLLEHVRRDLRRAGHGLGLEARAELEACNARLVELQVAFATNLSAFEDGIDVTCDDLEGLPADWIDRLKPGAHEGTLRVTLDYPDLHPFLDQSERRDLREQLSFKASNKAVEQNVPLLEEAVQLRRRVAELFGFEAWADHRLEPKMAANRATVAAFYGDLVPALQAKAAEERADMLTVHDGERVERWDLRYLHTRIKRERFGIDQNEVAAYFPLDACLDGLFAITEQTFGLRYRRIDDAEVWHEDVTTWEMTDRDSGRVLARFHLDLYPREGKFGHAAVFPLVAGHATDDGYVTPVSAMVANITAPTPQVPSLLKHDEVVMLFHEFGHVLHNSLGHARYTRFSGTSVEADFVEAPSQIMEHWCWTPDVLQRFARHHETGAAIPADLVERLVEARDLHVAITTLRQVESGLVDLAIHGVGPLDDLAAILADVEATVGYLPSHADTFHLAGFGHLMGGYDAGYYGYLWSMVYGDDMFSRFAEAGALDPEVGMAYRRTVLEAAGTRDAMDLLRAFLGREPNRDAFLSHLGITV